jgi:membrane-associated protein
MSSLAGAVLVGHTVLASAISPDTLIGKYGAVGLAVILFAECGLLVAFFLPGDTLLFSAGLLIATHGFKNPPPLVVPLIVLPLAVLAGDLLGYGVGRRAGPAVFSRPNSRMFRPEFVTRGEQFFARFGAYAVVLAGFVPVVRTVATVFAGVSRMRLATYVTASAIGAILWADGILLIGYGLGKIHYISEHQKTVTSIIDPLVIVVVLLSLAPVGVHAWRDRRQRRAS